MLKISFRMLKNGVITNEDKSREIADSLKDYALMSDYGKSLRAAKEMAAWKDQHPREGLWDSEKVRMLLQRMIWEVTWEDLRGDSTEHYDKEEFIEDFCKAMEE